MEFTAKQIADMIGGRVEGDEQAKINTFAKIEEGKKGAISFLSNPKYTSYIYETESSVVLINEDVELTQPVSCTLIRVKNAYESVAKLLQLYASMMPKKTGIDPLAFVSKSAKIGENVYIAPFAYIGDNVTIGEGTVIGKDCLIYPGVHIFPGMVIGDRVILHAGCIIGDDGFGNSRQSDGSWQKIEHLGNVIIGNDVEIGSNTTIDKAPMESTIIADGVRIDNLCQIAHNVVVGKNTAMAAQCGVAGSTKIGEGVIMGGQVGVVGHINIADGTTVCAKSAIIGNIRKSGQTLYGNPAIPNQTYLRAYAKFKKEGEE